MMAIMVLSKTSLPLASQRSPRVRGSERNSFQGVTPYFVSTGR
jgi:hypothetical protein